MNSHEEERKSMTYKPQVYVSALAVGSNVEIYVKDKINDKEKINGKVLDETSYAISIKTNDDKTIIIPWNNIRYIILSD